MTTLRVEGEKELLGLFARLTNSANRRDLMDQIGATGVSQTQQRFLDQSYDGSPWPASFRVKTKGGQTLRDKGHLFGSLTFSATDKAVEWGSNKIYAGIHQFGGVIRPKSAKNLKFRLANGKFVAVKQVTMPARPFLGITDANRAEILETAQDWMEATAS